MYFESDYANVEWNDEVKAAVLVWRKTASGLFFKEACSYALELAKKNQAKKWFSDTTRLGILNDVDANWFITDIIPELLKCGVTHQALIIPDSLIAKIQLNNASDKADELGMITRYFSFESEALNWLKTL